MSTLPTANGADSGGTQVPARDYAAERVHWEESLATHRRALERAVDERGRARIQGHVARVLGHLGFIAHRRGDTALALGLYGESLALKRQVGDALGCGLSLLALGALEQERDNCSGAAALHRECLDVARGLRDGWLLSQALDGVAAALAATEPARALRLAGAAGALREALGADESPEERAARQRALDAAARALPTGYASGEMTAGTALSVDAAAALALGVPCNTDVSSPPITEWVSGAFNRRAARKALSPWYGRLVDAGGHRLYMRRLGEGSPAVVLNAGLGSNWQAWESIVTVLARSSTMVAYSRAGLRDSEPGPLPRTAQLVCDDLRAMLFGAGIAPPYVLVGHSYGGMVLRLYASQHPKEVAGLVLMDAPDEDMHASWERHMAELPAEDREREERTWTGGNVIEHVDNRASGRQVFASRTVPDALQGVPVAYVASKWWCASYRNRDPLAPPPAAKDLEEVRARKSRRLGAEMLFFPAEQSGHELMGDQPEIVVEAIQAVLDAARHGRERGGGWQAG